jgi:molybdenum cofactor cytidylyltransferase
VSGALAARLGLGAPELVAFVGAGGKSTLLFELGEELAAARHRVVLTTTTKLGAEQAARARVLCRTSEAGAVAASLDGPGPVMVAVGGDHHKVTGPPPADIDRLYGSGVADFVLVEADGARRRAFKAPAAHEPVIPAAATLVVVVMGADAVGGVISEVCHRPERVAALTGRSPDDVLDAAACVAALTHPDGGLKHVPEAARAVVAITKVSPERRAVAQGIARGIDGTGRFERCVLLSAR